MTPGWMSTIHKDRFNNFNDNDNEVKSNTSRLEPTLTFGSIFPFRWSICSGSEWHTWINDGILGFQDTKYFIELPVSVRPTYRMTLKQETLSNPAQQ